MHTDEMTQKGYCGHWDDYALERTLSLKLAQLANMRRATDLIVQEIVFIRSEQVERRGK